MAHLVVPALLVCVAAAGCERATDRVTLGAVGPWHEEYGTAIKLGMDLAVEEVNRAGGVRGAPLTIVFRDDSARAERAVAIASEFVNDARVAAAIGPVNSGAMLAAARVYDGRLVALAPTAASPDLSGISPWVFRLISNDSVHGIALGRYLGTMGKKAAILYDNDSFGRGGAQAFRRNFPGVIVSEDPIVSGDPDLGAFIDFYKRSGVEILFVAGVEPSGRAALLAARARGFTGAIVGTDSWMTLVRDTALSNGVYIAARFTTLESRAAVQRFVASFEARYGRPPDGFAAMGYDATMLLAHVIELAGPDRQKIRDILASLDSTAPWRGVTGPLSFTRSGDPVTRGFFMLRVHDGTLTLLPSS